MDEDHAGLIDAKMELPPATPAAATVFRSRPLTLPDDGQPRAVEHEMEALAGRDRSQTAPQMLTAPGERRIVGGGEVEAHHPEQGVQESFGDASHEAKGRRGARDSGTGRVRAPAGRLRLCVLLLKPSVPVLDAGCVDGVQVGVQLPNRTNNATSRQAVRQRNSVVRVTVADFDTSEITRWRHATECTWTAVVRASANR